MNQNEALKYLADLGYRIGFGAKKHFSTYDIASKMPTLITLFVISISIIGLVYKGASAEYISCLNLIAGIFALFVQHAYPYQECKKYADIGSRLIHLYKDVEKIYKKVKVGHNYKIYESQVIKIEQEFYRISIHKQIIISDWYAHYKFFWQSSIDWVDEQKKFKFWRDKIPLPLIVILIISLHIIQLIAGICIVQYFCSIS